MRPSAPGATIRHRLLAAALVLGVLAAWVLGPARAGAQAEVVPTDEPTTVSADSELTTGKALVLGVVEGVTEFLPVSSTGHLLVSQRLMGIGTTDQTKAAADAYAVVIQLGAILAVVVLYWQRLLSMLRGLVGRDAEGRSLLVAVIVAFLPAAVVGLLFEPVIKDRLFGAWPVVAAWAAGGAALLVLSSQGWLERERHGRPLEQLGLRSAVVVGLAQVAAMWPGTSRSLVTIVAALLVGLSMGAAVEFSFLLGLATLGAATVYDGLGSGGEIVEAYGWFDPLVGFVAAFVSAVVAVRWMVGYLQRHSLAIFGWYRLGVAALAAVLLVAGVISAT